jgi:hypothetical protein
LAPRKVCLAKVHKISLLRYKLVNWVKFISRGVLGFPSLKTVLGIYFIEKEAALSNTGSNPLPTSVKLYSTLTGYSDTISLLIIPRCSSSRRRSVRTFGVMPSMFSINRLNCVWPLRISLITNTVHLFPITIWEN